MTVTGDDPSFRTRPVVVGRWRAGLLATAPGLGAFGLLLLVRETWSPLARLDQDTANDLHGYAVGHRAFVTFMKALSAAGSAPVYAVVFAALAAWLAWKRSTRLALLVVGTTLGSALVNDAVKLAMGRRRPVLPAPVAHANGMSFPSGHAQAAVVAYVLLFVIVASALSGVGRALVVAASVGMVLGVGFSRVALGVHYVSDVLAGYALGAGWVATVITAFRTDLGWQGRGGVHEP